MLMNLVIKIWEVVYEHRWNINFNNDCSFQNQKIKDKCLILLMMN